MPKPNERPQKPPVKGLFLIKTVGEKTYWNRVGSGFVNNDGSINVQVDFLPGVSLQLRDPKADDE